MIESDKRYEGKEQEGGDPASQFVRDFAQSPPAKSIETIKAASGAVEKVDREKRDARVRERAYHLWIEMGRPEGRQDECWHKANAEIGDETPQGE